MIKAIDTRYNGCYFRSRLEARWAVFFDNMRIKWRYELEGFQLPSGWYLPDFWFPDQNCWGEVKPVEFSDIELSLASELGDCFLLIDIPMPKTYIKTGCESSTEWILSPHKDGRFYFESNFNDAGWRCDEVRLACHAATMARF